MRCTKFSWQSMSPLQNPSYAPGYTLQQVLLAKEKFRLIGEFRKFTKFNVQLNVSYCKPVTTVT